MRTAGGTIAFLLAIGIFGLEGLEGEQLDVACEVKVVECGFQDIIKDLGEEFPDKDFLSENCEVFLRSGSCTLDRLQECSPSDVENIRPLLLLGKRVCDESDPLGEAYRQNVGCINENLDVFQRCVTEIPKVLSSFAKYILKLHYSQLQPTISHCLYRMTTRACFAAGMESACGADAAKIVNQVMQAFDPFTVSEFCNGADEELVQEQIVSYLRRN